MPQAEEPRNRRNRALIVRLQPPGPLQAWDCPTRTCAACPTPSTDMSCAAGFTPMHYALSLMSMHHSLLR